MLKWTASAQRLNTMLETPSVVSRTPRYSEAKRRKRRATIANKENLPITSTPMVPRNRNSPVVTGPLSDILNITPEPIMNDTPERRRSTSVTSTLVQQNHRRHSTIGLTLPTAVPQYARTLPRYEEEYSPSTDLPTGQVLALRGLVPEPFLGNARYFSSPEVITQHCKRVREMDNGILETKPLPKKRNLENEFCEMDKEALVLTSKKPLETTVLSSAKMGDETLDKLIDAILDSARKDEKKKKSRKSFNLRRRTLLKNQADQQNEIVLSPSYAAGDDPASDLSFLLQEPKQKKPSKTFKQPRTPKFSSALPATPEPHTPLPGSPIAEEILLQLPTPAKDYDSNTFEMETPARTLPQKRHKERPPSEASTATPPKKFKVDSKNYFEVGLALPSIYV